MLWRLERGKIGAGVVERRRSLIELLLRVVASLVSTRQARLRARDLWMFETLSRYAERCHILHDTNQAGTLFAELLRTWELWEEDIVSSS